MELGLKGKVAIVTGGTQGIGKAAAILLAKEGARVVIAARGQELLEAVAAEIRSAGGKVAAVRADVGQKADCERLVAEAVKAFGRVDILSTMPELRPRENSFRSPTRHGRRISTSSCSARSALRASLFPR